MRWIQIDYKLLLFPPCAHMAVTVHSTFLSVVFIVTSSIIESTANLQKLQIGNDRNVFITYSPVLSPLISWPRLRNHSWPSTIIIYSRSISSFLHPRLHYSSSTIILRRCLIFKYKTCLSVTFQFTSVRGGTRRKKEGQQSLWLIPCETFQILLIRTSCAQPQVHNCENRESHRLVSRLTDWRLDDQQREWEREWVSYQLVGSMFVYLVNLEFRFWIRTVLK